MAESGSSSLIRASQKRLTALVTGFALIGIFTLSLIWWDSVEFITSYSTQKRSIFIGSSAVSHSSVSLMSLGMEEPYWRGKLEIYDLSDQPLFPLPEVNSDFISIPIYLLILTYLATLLLIWVVLMNRLARRDFTKPKSIPTKE